MSEGLAERIRQCADMAGSGDELARMTGIPRRTLEYYLTGKSEPKIGRCVDIAKAAGVDLVWLATGERGGKGKAEVRGEPDASFAYVPLFDSRCTEGQSRWRECADVIGQLAFSVSSLVAHSLDDRSLAAIKVEGDSMEGLLSDGDVVMFDYARSVLDAEAMYVIRIEGRLYPKRLQRQFDGSVHVISENKAYRDLVIPKGSVSELEILGRVVWSGEWMV